MCTIYGYHDMGHVALLVTIAAMTKIEKARTKMIHATSFILRAATDSRSSYMTFYLHGAIHQWQSCMCHTLPYTYAASSRSLAAPLSVVPYLEHCPILSSGTAIVRFIRFALWRNP